MKFNAYSWQLVSCSIAIVTNLGCGTQGTPYDRDFYTSSSVTGQDSGSSGTPQKFAEIELAVIRHELGNLAATPPPDPTNQYADNEAAALLGQKLFFEMGYSANGQVSCATCHDPSKAYQDDRGNVSQGINFTNRHSPSLLNAAYGSGDTTATVWQFWDGRKDSLWSQALSPPENPNEIGGTRTKVALLIYDKYRTDYEAVFGAMTAPALRDATGTPIAPDTAMPGTPDWPSDVTVQRKITEVYVNFGKAIAAYERKLVSRGSKFDAFVTDIQSGQDDSDKLSSTEKDGLRVFIGTGRCVSCHLGPNLTDGKFHNIGVSQLVSDPHVPAQDNGHADGIPKVKADEFNCASSWSDQKDKTACAVNTLSAIASDLGAFKTPSLRNVAAKAPYFHTGGAATLAKVVEFYNKGGDSSGFVGTVDNDVTQLELSTSDQQNLIEFMAALNGQPVDPSLTAPPAN